VGWVDGAVEGWVEDQRLMTTFGHGVDVRGARLLGRWPGSSAGGGWVAERRRSRSRAREGPAPPAGTSVPSGNWRDSRGWSGRCSAAAVVWVGVRSPRSRRQGLPTVPPTARRDWLRPPKRREDQDTTEVFRNQVPHGAPLGEARHHRPEPSRSGPRLKRATPSRSEPCDITAICALRHHERTRALRHHRPLRSGPRETIRALIPPAASPTISPAHRPAPGVGLDQKSGLWASRLFGGRSQCPGAVTLPRARPSLEAPPEAPLTGL
jgi:hypothetical protein